MSDDAGPTFAYWTAIWSERSSPSCSRCRSCSVSGPAARHRFHTALEDATRLVGQLALYLALSASPHVRLLRVTGPWSEVTFPGDRDAAWRRRAPSMASLASRREIVDSVRGTRALALLDVVWSRRRTVPGAVCGRSGVRLMRAPGRFGFVVAFGLSVLAGLATDGVAPEFVPGLTLAIVRSPLGRRAARAAVVSAGVARRAGYRVLATLPRGPVIEMPLYSRRSIPAPEYMLSSTAHWMPLVNGYSDYTPADFATTS